MAEQRFSLDERPPVAILRLTRSELGNRLDHELIAALAGAVAGLADGGLTRALVLTGTNGVFSRGWDAALLAEEGERSALIRRDGLAGNAFQWLADSPLPVLAAVDGEALSAGFELALACDVRLASTRASFGFPETSMGRLPMAGGTQRLARIAGRAVALELILTAEPIPASAALARGIISAVFEPDDLLAAAVRQAHVIAERGPLAVRLAKEAVYHGLDMPLEQALRFETDLTVLLQTTADRAEGVRAFVEKRPPRFTGA